MHTSLAELNPGDCAEIISVDSPIAQRLGELGLTEGAVVECVLRSPFYDPAAYRIRGAVIAIRGKDCRKIWVKTYEA